MITNEPAKNLDGLSFALLPKRENDEPKNQEAIAESHAISLVDQYRTRSLYNLLLSPFQPHPKLQRNLPLDTPNPYSYQKTGKKAI
jgi:hypothetical protein